MNGFTADTLFFAEVLRLCNSIADKDMSGFDDYIRDIPMDIGTKFFPRAGIQLPNLPMPVIPNLSKKYNFEAEHRARVAYDKYKASQENSKISPTSAEKAKAENPTHNQTYMPHEVLQPMRQAPSLPASQPVASTSSSNSQPTISYEEFEGRGSVFDEVELRSINDREALSQVLKYVTCVQSAPKTPLPVNASSLTATALPSYPQLSFGESTKKNGTVEPVITVTKTAVAFQQAPSNSITDVVTKNGIVTPPTNVQTSTNGISSGTQSSLRTRLLTKGYRENLVSVALSDVPRERLVHIEFYMKGMSVLEKRGVPINTALKYLLDSKVVDKEEVLNRANTADQLIGMGFGSDVVFSALNAVNGDRVRALESILST